MRPLTSPSALILTRIAAAMLVVSALSAGVLTATGSAKRGEANTAEQLGNDSINLSKVPVNVSGLTADVASIKETQRYTCVVTATRGAKCWGLNADGQLGNNSKANSRVPVDVRSLTAGGALITAGGTHSCAVTSKGPTCWVV